MSYKNKEKYIDLKFNGKLFPSWIVANFKEYSLLNGDVVKGSDIKKYQAFIGKFLDYNSIYKDILVYHGLGSGKTRTIINLYNVLYNNYPGWNVFILLKATLKENWLKELDTYLQEEDKETRKSNIIFISYDSPIADKTFLDEIKKADVTKKNLYVIEEVHNFISNVYNNIVSKKGKRGITIYNHILNDKKENPDTRVVLISGTPSINVPYEFALLFNLLRPNIFPYKNEVEFNKEFINLSGTSININKKNMFQRRILGLVSYYATAASENFATSETKFISVPMSKYQEQIYDYFENMENEYRMKKKRNLSSETFINISRTRQACNFVFPIIGSKITGELRPRPSDYNLSDKLGRLLEESINTKLENESKNSKILKTNLFDYEKIINKFVSLFDEYINDFNNKDLKDKHTVVDDLNTYINKYKQNYDEFLNNEKKKSRVFNELFNCSPKMLIIIFTLMTSPGPVIVYSNFVKMEGIQIFKIYLKYFNFESLDAVNIEKEITNNNKKIDEKLRYTEYHGDIDTKIKKINKDVFNLEINKYGKICKVFLLSASGAEGLNLFSIRQVHIMEPYWHEVRIIQIIGRSMRYKSHKFLPKEEWFVNVYRYTMISNKKEYTTDKYIENTALDKEGLKESFLLTIKEAAIDCLLYRSHNIRNNEFKCFEFEEAKLFEDQIEPAYKENVKYDSKFNSGLNDPNSKIEQIKVIKIKAVKQLEKDKEVYSKPEIYWYYPISRIIYDYEFKTPVGKIKVDEYDIPILINDNTYIIDKMLLIPMIK